MPPSTHTHHPSAGGELLGGGACHGHKYPPPPPPLHTHTPLSPLTPPPFPPYTYLGGGLLGDGACHVPQLGDPQARATRGQVEGGCTPDYSREATPAAQASHQHCLLTSQLTRPALLLWPATACWRSSDQPANTGCPAATSLLQPASGLVTLLLIADCLPARLHPCYSLLQPCYSPA